MATIGRAIGRSRKTVAKYVDELVEAWLIFTEPAKVTTADGLRFYLGYLKTKDADEYLPRVLAQTLDGKLGSLGDRVGRLLFKLAYLFERGL